MGIPKITHQIWMQGFENLPEKFRKNVDGLHSLNPEFFHKQWNETDLRRECQKYGEECAARFDSFDKMILKVDLGRYVVLYNYGGISIDTDMVPLKPLSDTPGIDSDDFIVSYAPFPFNYVKQINNATILAPPNNDTLRELIDSIIADKRICSDFSTNFQCVNAITGPLKFNEVVSKSHSPVKYIGNKYYEPCFSHDIGCRIDKDAIMDHQHEGSWVSSYDKYITGFFLILLCNIIYVIGIVLFIIIYMYRKVLFPGIKIYKYFR